MYEVIITGLCTAVLAPLVTHFLQKRMRLRLLETPSRGFIGEWKGNMLQHLSYDGAPVAYNLTISISEKTKKNFIGKIVFNREETNRTSFCEFVAKTYHSRYLLIEYKSSGAEQIQFGSIVLGRSGDGKMLKGLLVGYAPLTEAIVNANIELNKVANT